jgi:hypothetical protein
MGKTETIFPKVRNEARVPTLPALIQHGLGILGQSNKAEKRNKRKMEEVKLSLFTHDMTLYIKDLKTLAQKLLYTVNSFSKVAG